MKGISRLAKELLASQEEVCSMEIDNCFATLGIRTTDGMRRVWLYTKISGYTG
jgi:hypothetical protein